MTLLAQNYVAAYSIAILCLVLGTVAIAIPRIRRKALTEAEENELARQEAIKARK